MPGCDRLEGFLEVGVGFHAIETSRFDELRNTLPRGGTLVVAGKQYVLAIESDWADEILHAVGIHLHTTVLEKHLETVSVPGNIDPLLAEAGFGQGFPRHKVVPADHTQIGDQEPVSFHFEEECAGAEARVRSYWSRARN